MKKYLLLFLFFLSINAWGQTDVKDKKFSIKTDFQGREYNLTYNIKSFFYKDSLNEPESIFYYNNEYNYFDIEKNTGIGANNSRASMRDPSRPRERNVKYKTINTIEALKLFKNAEKIKNKQLSTLYFTEEKSGRYYYYFGEISMEGVYYNKSQIQKGAIPNGYGILIVSDSEDILDDPEHKIYEGDFVSGKTEGFGILNVANERDSISQISVIGNFSNKLNKGAMRKVWENGIWTEGIRINGLAKKVWADGTSLEGNWIEDKLSYGEVRIPNKGKYMGSVDYQHRSSVSNSRNQLFIKDMTMSGNSMFLYDNGDTLSGNFRSGELYGTGTLKTKEYEYKGRFVENGFSGAGTQRFFNGVTYIGNWVENKKNGEFIEVDSTGKKVKSLWNNGKRVADENDPLYSKLNTMPKVLRDMYLIDNGKFFNQLKRYFIAGSGGVTSFSGQLIPDSDGIFICKVNATAGGYRYNTINCIELQSFEFRGNNIYLEFSGNISKVKDNSTIKTVRRSDGKFEKIIVPSLQSYETMKLTITIFADLGGKFKSYSLCFMNDGGRQDCGMGTYNGEISTQKLP